MEPHVGVCHDAVRVDEKDTLKTHICGTYSMCTHAIVS
jgi:hypothetical protein